MMKTCCYIVSSRIKPSAGDAGGHPFCPDMHPEDPCPTRRIPGTCADEKGMGHDELLGHVKLRGRKNLAPWT